MSSMTVKRTCDWCGQAFMPETAHQNFCCPEHAAEAANARRRAKRAGIPYQIFIEIERDEAAYKFARPRRHRTPRLADEALTIEEVVKIAKEQNRSYGDVAGDYYRAILHQDMMFNLPKQENKDDQRD